VAEGDPAVHAAAGLKPPFLIGKLDFNLAVIVDPFLNGPVARAFSLYL
jgi:hypothetical protein